MVVLFKNSSLVVNKIYRNTLGLLFFMLALFAASDVFAADVLISPSNGSYSTGQTFTVSVMADPKGAQINAVESKINFDKSLLSVVNVSKAGSAFSLWTTEPEFSNAAGTVTFGGGSPTPFSKRSKLMSITFRTKKDGTAKVSFGPTSVLAADGRGTDVFGSATGGTYTITAATTPTTPEPSDDTSSGNDEDSNAAIAFGDPPRAPEVGSQAFLDPELWYNKTDGVFTWEIPFDVTAVAVEIATSSDNDPSEVYDPPIDEFVVNSENLSDGVQYLSVQFKNQVGWGSVTNRKIQIDTTPPEPFDIRVQAGTSTSSFPLLVFDAKDVTSGIDHYTLEIADSEPFDITPDEARLGYLITELEDGTYTVKVTAYDKAGNSTESTTPVLITAGWKPESDTENKASIWDLFTGKNILIFFLFLIAIIEFVYIIYQRKQFAKKEAKLRKETKEIQDQMEKIFSALRDEIYDQINTITKRPRLSAREKEAVEGLTQALEVSETLIEKEINDVKKILK